MKRRAGQDSDGRHAAAPAAGSAGLERALGHRFDDPALLAAALTHRSAAGGAHRFGNERLEFLGDRVLGLVVADLLLEAFPDEPEGALARRFASLVRRETLEDVAEAISLGRHLMLSDAEERSGGRRNRSLQADACEAVLGALYLDGGLEAARGFILRHWRPLLATGAASARDAKTRLQEWAQARGLALPDYVLVARTGPDHEPVFTVEARVEGQDPAAGMGSSKRAAEQAAAGALLARIGGEDRGDD